MGYSKNKKSHLFYNAAMRMQTNALDAGCIRLVLQDFIQNPKFDSHAHNAGPFTPTV